jgi:hypothetical protein
VHAERLRRANARPFCVRAFLSARYRIEVPPTIHLKALTSPASMRPRLRAAPWRLASSSASGCYRAPLVRVRVSAGSCLVAPQAHRPGRSGLPAPCHAPSTAGSSADQLAPPGTPPGRRRADTTPTFPFDRDGGPPSPVGYNVPPGDSTIVATANLDLASTAAVHVHSCTLFLLPAHVRSRTASRTHHST